MKHPLLLTEVQDFINASLDKNLNQLALKKNPFPDLAYTDLIGQIDSKVRCMTKLPTWYAAKDILFAPKLSIEQTSSEALAQYKASLVKGDSLIDLTGGFGVDAYYFAKNISLVTHCEIQESLSQIVAHNFSILGVNNIQCVSGDSLEYLEQNKTRWDYLYLDPARRDTQKKKVFLLKDCTPNVPELLDRYFTFSDTIIVKTAPLLDISSAMGELHSVKQIHIVGLNNEVKELLWVLQKNYTDAPEMLCVNIQSDHISKITIVLNQSYFASYSAPLRYLYEPNACLMKSGQFDYISEHFNLFKLQAHSHLYTSDTLMEFPGRVFEIQENVAFTNKNAKAFLSSYAGHITTRNFPLKVQEIRKKYNVKDAPDAYLFCTTDINTNKIMLFCTKLNSYEIP